MQLKAPPNYNSITVLTLDSILFSLLLLKLLLLSVIFLRDFNLLQAGLWWQVSLAIGQFMTLRYSFYVRSLGKKITNLKVYIWAFFLFCVAFQADCLSILYLWFGFLAIPRLLLITFFVSMIFLFVIGFFVRKDMHPGVLVLFFITSILCGNVVFRSAAYPTQNILAFPAPSYQIQETPELKKSTIIRRDAEFSLSHYKANFLCEINLEVAGYRQGDRIYLEALQTLWFPWFDKNRGKRLISQKQIDISDSDWNQILEHFAKFKSRFHSIPRRKSTGVFSISASFGFTFPGPVSIHKDHRVIFFYVEEKNNSSEGSDSALELVKTLISHTNFWVPKTRKDSFVSQ
jgi:hypothetical protein